jgi:hypothetical protein
MSPSQVMPPSQPAAKRPSKWDKPKDPPPPPVNRKNEDEADAVVEDLPPTAITRNLVTRFSDAPSAEAAERKPIRKMTPPRDEVQRGVAEYHEQVAQQPAGDVVRSREHTQEEESEKPPADMTKSLLAKFQTMEASSPSKHVPSPSNISVETSNQIRQSSRASPDSGISLLDSQPSAHPDIDVANGGVYESTPVHVDGVVRSGEEASKEEMPEQGFTRNLLAQWRTLEQGSGGQPSLPKPRSSAPKAPQAERVMQIDGQCDEHRDVVRESDQNEEEYLPPPSFTKNMLAHFQSMESQSPKPSTPSNQRVS